MSAGGQDILRGCPEAVPRRASYTHYFGAGIGLVLGIALLADYGDAILRGRHAVDSPAANSPLTAVCIILLSLAALATSGSRPTWRIAAQAAIGLGLLLILARLRDIYFDDDIMTRLFPFSYPLPRAASAQRPTAFADTSAISLALLAAAEWLLQHRLARTGQLLLAGAACGFLLALLGYGAMLPPFHNPVALFIGLAGVAIVLAVIAGAADTGFLRGLAGNRTPARLVRRWLGLATLGILLIGGISVCLCGPRGGALMIGAVLLILAWTWVTGIVIARRVDSIEPDHHTTTDHLPHDPGTDSLTGLLNRNKMDELLSDHRGAPEAAAIIMIDIDRFRCVNNALGTAAGDSLLVQAAKRLSGLAEPHRVARAGGDDFAIVCNGIGAAAADRLAQAVVETMAVPFSLDDGRQFHVTASVGVAHGAVEGTRELRHAADEAMHIAKSQGGNQAVPYACAMHEARLERIGLEQDLHRAFKSSSELSLVYQPIVSLRDCRVVAVEALARWQHPQRGAVPPSRFVAIAESSGMFLALGAKLRELAVEQAAQWRDAAHLQDAGYATASGRLPVINLNVSPLELARSDVPGTLGALIDRHGLERGGFCLEVTEGSFADERALHSLQAARDAGFKVAMDDFGVGYSSLAQLPRLPLTSVKLDRSFLEQATDSEAGISLLATVVQLAHVLKLPVVAEGVENRRELRIVSDCGCDSVQGFLFSEPLTAEQLEPWLKPDHKAQAPADPP
jgi:diguanylate cyclase (GGDEF)-like protein